MLIVSSLLAKIPTPGYLTYSSTKAFTSQVGRGLSFEFEGLGVDVLTYEPGMMSSNHFESKGLKFFAEPVMKSARIALAELEMSPYGASCGTNIKHEMTEYLWRSILTPFGLYNYYMFRYGFKSF